MSFVLGAGQHPRTVWIVGHCGVRLTDFAILVVVVIAVQALVFETPVPTHFRNVEPGLGHF